MPNRLVVIEHHMLDAWSVDHAWSDFSGCLSHVRNAKAATGCKKCGRASGKDASAYNAAKLCLVALPQADRDLLKARLGADTVRVVVSQNGKVVPYSF